MTKQPLKPLTDQLRQAIDVSGLTRYQIAKETGIDESALAKFYNGHRGLSMEALNALGECLRLRLVADPAAQVTTTATPATTAKSRRKPKE